MKIFISIPVLNHVNVTVQCLKLLSAQTFQKYEIIVIDDGSTDGTANVIKDNHPEVTVLSGDGNLWWTRAMNLSVKYALGKAGPDDYILTFNNDVTFEKTYLENLAEAAYLRPGRLIGSVSYDQADHLRLMDSGGYYDWKTFRVRRKPIDPSDKFNDDVNFLSSRGALIPVKAFMNLGLYNQKRLPHYAADTEFTLRAHRAGFKICVCYQAILYSDQSVSGLSFAPFQKLEWGKAWPLLISRKSKQQVKTRINFVLLASPRKYLIRNLARAIRESIAVISCVKPFWIVTQKLLPIIEYFRSRKRNKLI